RSPLDRDALQTLAGALSGRAVARLLCLPAGTRRCDAEVVLVAYDRVGVDAVCLTKWGETMVPGESLAAVIGRGLGLSPIATGQEVPADIVAAEPAAIAQAAWPAAAAVTA